MTEPFATPAHPGESPQPRRGEQASRDTPLPDGVAYRDFLRVDLTDGPPVPISIWRAVGTERDNEETIHQQLARRVVVTYSRRDGTVVDFDGDPGLREAAAATSRLYLPVTQPADLADIDAVQVDLVVLRWPRPHSVVEAVADLFRAFRLVVTPDGFAVLIVDPTQDGGSNPEQSRRLIPEARSGGMRYLQRIIVITVPTAVTSGDTAPADDTTSGDTATGRPVRVDVLVFVVAGGRRG
ncbi:hypothetical protein [Verrucosispora sp. WMMD573]|uniref:hypothetical protein n=1 Tax=Verrucosispora sp. WMMD573 TaxID=3015149 RepID=UPI00248CF44D|nr:hypothetical protein [Verrucosispora sp. WMMD573]WBB52435.1 hypothetical protein O7601_17770 [Verrucosispora sp. WMMD573]